MIEFYNSQVKKYKKNKTSHVKDFISYDKKKISWDRELIDDCTQEQSANYNENNIRYSLYRPFCRQWFYFDKHV